MVRDSLGRIRTNGMRHPTDTYSLARFYFCRILMENEYVSNIFERSNELTHSAVGDFVNITRH